MRFIKLLFHIAVFLSIISCHDEIDDKYTCPDLVIELGTFLFHPLTKNAIPYRAGNRAVVFKDHLGREVIFLMDSVRTEVYHIEDMDACPFDASIDIPFRHKREILYTGFHNDSLQLDINLQYRARLDTEGSAIISEHDDFIASVSTIPQHYYVSNSVILITKVGNPDTTQMEPLETFEINGKAFPDVYALEFAPGARMKTYFNLESGIIGLKHISGYPSLAFDRIE